MRYWAPYIILIVFTSLVFSQEPGNEPSKTTDGKKEKPKPKAKTELREYTNEAFQVGEKLVYRVHYGVVDAGEAVLEVKEGAKVKDRPTYHIVGTGRSLGAFNLFFKVRDRYETIIDKEAIVPYVFLRRVDEGGYKISQDYLFNPYKSTVNTGDSVYQVTEYMQDLLSSFYYARTLNFDTIEVGDEYPVSMFLDDEIWTMKIKFLGREKIRNRSGKYNCLKFRPLVQEGRVFKEDESLYLWITDDKNHVPIRLKAEIFVGSIKMDLKSHEGLANPVAEAD